MLGLGLGIKNMVSHKVIPPEQPFLGGEPVNLSLLLFEPFCLLTTWEFSSNLNPVNNTKINLLYKLNIFLFFYVNKITQ